VSFVKNVFGVVSLIVSLHISAQDIHFSQYNAAPLQLNPAFAGLNSCDYRIGLNARTQWNTISNGNTYSTLGAAADFSIGKVTKYNSFAGMGLMLSSDIAGSLGLNSNRVDVSLAYHFMIDKRGNQSLSAGLQFGVNHRGINPDKATTDAQYNPFTGKYDASLPTKENFGRANMIYLDASFGALYSINFSGQRNNIYLGIAAFHLSQPNISFASSGLFNDKGSERLYIKTNIHGGGSFILGTKTWIMPNFLVQLQGPSQQYNVGALVKLRAGNNISRTFVYAGLQYRVLDALILQARLDYKGLGIGFSYDVNISKLTSSSFSYGGPELSIVYQGCMNKKPKPFFCPTM
jgi:type IX secretion system PorP/SprF family membrane protein